MQIQKVIRLLIVEDSPAYLYLIQRAFRGRAENTRWELMIATDGEQAIQLLFGEETGGDALPDIILLDWKLPKLGGDEVLRRVKQHGKLRKIPVLIFSSSNSEVDIHSAYSGFANGYITKPSDSLALGGIVEAIEQFWTSVVELPKVVRQPASNSLTP